MGVQKYKPNHLCGLSDKISSAVSEKTPFLHPRCSSRFRDSHKLLLLEKDMEEKSERLITIYFLSTQITMKPMTIPGKLYTATGLYKAHPTA